MNKNAQLIITEADLKELQNALALRDFDSPPTHKAGTYGLLIHKLYSTKMRMRADRNHARPHFHIEYKKEYTASYTIDDPFRCLAGKMPAKYEEPILNWAQNKREVLLNTWNRLKAGEVVEIIKEP